MYSGLVDSRTREREDVTEFGVGFLGLVELWVPSGVGVVPCGCIWLYLFIVEDLGVSLSSLAVQARFFPIIFIFVLSQTHTLPPFSGPQTVVAVSPRLVCLEQYIQTAVVM